MIPQLIEIERKASRLPIREREELAERLIQGLGDVPLTEVETTWVQLAERRFDAYMKGKRKGISASLAFKQIRRKISR